MDVFTGSLAELQQEIGKRVVEARKACKMTKNQLAAFAGTSITTVMDIESGKRGPKVSLLYKLAKALEVPPLSLLPDEWHRVESAPVRKIVKEVEESNNSPRVVGGSGEEDVNANGGPDQS